jgi:hypothetical protein
VESVDRELGPLLADPDRLEQDGARIDTYLRMTRGYQPIATAMAIMISTVHGEKRLQECTSSPGAFLHSYQEATLLTRDEPLNTDDKLHDQILNSMPPFFEPDFKKLLAFFPES